MTEHVQSLEAIGLGTIPELDTDKVPVFRSRAGTDFKGNSRSVIGQTVEVGIVFRDLGHVEERDHGLVGGLDEQELKGVTVEGNTLQSGEDGVHGGTSSDCEEIDQKQSRRRRTYQIRTVTNSAHVCVGEELVLMPVDQFSSLVDVGRREAVCVSLVVGQLGVDVVIDIPLFEYRN